MSSHHRDPFPMTSKEAQSLKSSVQQCDDSNTPTEEWHSMGTTTAVAAPTSDALAVDGAGDSLVGKSKKKTDDIYEDAERQEQQQQDNDPDDDFLDRPLSEFRTNSRMERCLNVTLRTLRKIYTRLYGDQLAPSEMARTLCLASTLFFMIGGYWLLRSLKDPVLTALCGVTVIPKAKMLSVLVVLGVVSIYNRLLDSAIPHYKLFYVFGTFYFGLFTIIALLLMHDTIGLANQQPSPFRILGWISYCSIESFGSVMVSLFWSFANSNFTLESAKANYGVMVATAQVGSIIGPTIVNRYAAKVGVAKCYLLGALCMLMLQITMHTYIRYYGATERNASTTTKTNKTKEKSGITEGLYLFWEYNYVKGIFAISCLFMVEVTIVDFTMKVLARDYFAAHYPCTIGMSCYNAEDTDLVGMSEDATELFTTFMGLFGQATNTLSFLLSLLGTSAVIRYLGLRLSLLLFPTLCLAVIIFVRLRPTLYVVFAAMMTLKACSYALNNPTKEILYQPTSAAVRYKAKSWIDIFGARGSKALGSLVTNAFSDSASSLVANGSLVGMAVASFLIWNARFMGKKFDEYTESGYIVGESGGGGGDVDDYDGVDGVAATPAEKNIEMAMIQNDNQDTSCAILDDDDDEVGPEEEGQEVEEHEGEDDVEEVDEDQDNETTPTATVTMV